jgi:large subunit ribosomal protein L23
MDKYDIIKRPIITERSMSDATNKRYTFEVDKGANKYQIKDAVEAIFNVKVVAVNTMNMKGKQRRQGRTEGKKPDWKKAIVTLSEGEIKFFDN